MFALILAAVGAAQISVVSFMEPPPPKFNFNNTVAWSALPTLDQLYDAYPLKEHGRATVKIDCDVGKNGELMTCGVYYQRPDRNGVFGQAALTLARYFRVRPDYVDPILAAGSRVSVELVLIKRGEDDTPRSMSRCLGPACEATQAPPPVRPPFRAPERAPIGPR